MPLRREQPLPSPGGIEGDPTFVRIRAALAEHRRRLAESERAFRRWQAQSWTRERVIGLQIRRIQLQLQNLPLSTQPASVLPNSAPNRPRRRMS